MMHRPLLKAEHIVKSYRDGAVCALSDVCIEVEAGECVGLIGPSGSGKSTLARIVTGLEDPDAGTVTFGGVERSGKRLPKTERRAIRDAWLDMQMVFQNPAASFSPHMDIARAIAEGLAYRNGYDRKAAAAKVSETMEAVGLPIASARKRCFELSGGECQRAAIARAIIGSPRLIVCDEPTASLDVTVQARIMDLLRELHEHASMSFLFITHDIELMSGFCTRAYRLKNGRVSEILIAEGS